MYTQYDSTGHSHTRYSLEDHAWNAKADHVDSFSNFSKTNVKTNKWTNEKEGGFLELLKSKLYIPSTPNNSIETHSFMCLGRTGCFGQR